jgi:hypothetical protein
LSAASAASGWRQFGGLASAKGHPGVSTGLVGSVGYALCCPSLHPSCGALPVDGSSPQVRLPASRGARASAAGGGIALKRDFSDAFEGRYRRKSLMAPVRQPHPSQGSTASSGQIAFARAAFAAYDPWLARARLGRITMLKRSSKPNGATMSRRPSCSRRTPKA